MSLLSGFAGLAGTADRIDFQDSGTAAGFFRGLGVDSLQRICCAIFSAGTFYKDGFLYSPGSLICYEVDGAVAGHISGIPVNSVGAICIELAPMASYYQGVPLTANGRVAFI